MPREPRDSRQPAAARPHAQAHSRVRRRELLGTLAWVASASPFVFGCGSDDTGSDDTGEGDSSDPTPEPPEGNTSALEPGSEATPASGALSAPPWDEVPACVASNTDGAGQGPFFIHDAEREDDIDLFRQDIRGRYDESAEAGTELELHVRILDATSEDCGAAPLAGVEVYIWHTDGQGYYSGFGDAGDQHPDDPYAGVPNQNDLKNPDRFCRGAQVTDANGVVSFRSIFPGWYNGRDVHIHLMVFRPGSEALGRTTYAGAQHLFTTQFYFDRDLTNEVHTASEPYLRRTGLGAYEGAIAADEPNDSGLHAKASFDGTRVVAQMQVLVGSG